MRCSSLAVVAASALALSSIGQAQSVISAHSGVLHYYEGDVTIDGQAPHQKTGTFADVKEKQELQTQIGRAEVLLTPGVFLRMGENTGIRMVSNKLSNTEVNFLNGSAILDFVEVTKDNSVKVAYQDYQVTFLKKGIYRFDSQPAQFKVYMGEAVVSHGGSSVTLKDGRELPFTPALVSEKFDSRTGDALYRWAKRRSENIAVANLSAARRAGSSYTGGTNGSGGFWSFNPYFSMFTYIPMRGIMCDPFSYYACYYSPASAWNYYYPPVRSTGGGGGGYGVGSSYNAAGYYPTSAGTSTAMSSYSSSVHSGSNASASTSSSGGYSSGGFSGGGAASAGGGGISGGGGGGGGVSHGGGSAGGHGR